MQHPSNDARVSQITTKKKAQRVPYTVVFFSFLFSLFRIENVAAAGLGGAVKWGVVNGGVCGQGLSCTYIQYERDSPRVVLID